MRISTSQKRVREIVSEAAIVQAWSTLHNKTSVLWGILERESASRKKTPQSITCRRVSTDELRMIFAGEFN